MSDMTRPRSTARNLAGRETALEHRYGHFTDQEIVLLHLALEAGTVRHRGLGEDFARLLLDVESEMKRRHIPIAE